ncbi:hypothetical protein [Singulisphaera sp. GP187]|uniref:hypothetical protein n=1 Tax=Singulisphaera sp. GP187 TaxID=1882752 RepID=UPI0011612BC9|nr:hypothetical protein [Singulisphaera sp. GP187]
MRNASQIDMFADYRDPIFEGRLDPWCVEDDEGHLPSEVAPTLATYDPDHPLKRLVADPVFTVEKRRGQAFEEPVSRMGPVPQAGIMALLSQLDRTPPIF